MITSSLSFILLLVNNEVANSFFAKPPINNNFGVNRKRNQEGQLHSSFLSRTVLPSRRLIPIISIRATKDNEKGVEKQNDKELTPVLSIDENDDRRFLKDKNKSTAKIPMFFASQLEIDANDEKDDIRTHPSYSSSSDSLDENIGLPVPSKREDKDENKLPFGKEISDYISKPQSELIDAGLVLLSCFIVAIDTLPQASLPNFLTPTIIYNIEELLSYFFCIGYILRWYAVGGLSLTYFTKPLPIIDFFASVMPLLLTSFFPFVGGNILLPAWITSNNSALVNLRLLRILRLQELLVDRETFNGVAQILKIESDSVRPYQLELARVFITIFTLFSVATGLIYTAEHEVNPLIPDYFTAAYFGLTTLTTVGFGDITPITLNGRLVVMGSILVAVAVVPAQAAALVDALLDLQAERRQKDLMKNTLRTRMEGGGGLVDDMVDPRISCPSCGRRSHRSDAAYCYFCGEKLWQ